MKPRRADEVQFGGTRAPPRILTTQHSSARKYFYNIFSCCLLIYAILFLTLFSFAITVGPNIQYHIGSGVLKTNVTENPNIGGPAPTVQYTTSKYYIRR